VERGGEGAERGDVVGRKEGWWGGVRGARREGGIKGDRRGGGRGWMGERREERKGVGGR